MIAPLTTASSTMGQSQMPGNRAAKIGDAVDLLIIDDDPQMVRLLTGFIASPTFRITTATTVEEGCRLAALIRPAIVLLDLVMPGVEGFEALDQILAIDAGIDVMMVTAHYSPEAAVEAIRRGAFDYVTKPFSTEYLHKRLSGWLEDAQRRKQALRLDGELVKAFQFAGIIGRSPAILDLFSRIRRIAPHFETAVVTGETGTGKELVAKALHTLGQFSSGPFVVCNCAAIPEHLFESELFGHVRGAFTGANQDRAGFVKAAHRGTLLLDEIGELPLHLQPKLLRLLQNRESQKLGSPHPERVDVRVVAATNRDLRSLVKEHKLREDLYYRLSTVEIKLPRLGERREDLPMLQRHFLDLYSTRFGKGRMNLTRRAQAAMSRYDWPGNVRELENVIAGCCMMAEGTTIDVHYLPEQLRLGDKQAPTDRSTMTMAQMQLSHAHQVLQYVNGNRARAAAMLGIGRATLYRLIANGRD